MQKVQKESYMLCLMMALLFIIGQACETGGSNRESIENDNSYEMIEGEEEAPAEESDTVQNSDTLNSAEILEMKKLQDEGIRYHRLLDSIAEHNPNISYTYTPSKDGKIKTVLGDYKVEVDGSMTPDKKHSIAVLLERRFENRRKMLDYYNKLNHVDMPARPVQGYAAFYEELRKNLDYPAEVKSIDVEGLLFVELAVEKNGEISNIKIAESINADDEIEEAIEESAIKAIKETQTQWNAAQTDGKPVRSKIEIPVWLDSNMES